MARLTPITAEQIATRTGTTAAHVGELAAIGVVRPGADGAYTEADVARLRMALAFEAAGIGPDQIQQAVADGDWTFEWLHLFLRPPGAMTGRTYAEFVVSLGSRGMWLERVYAALGLPEPELGAPTYAAEEEMLRQLIEAWDVDQGPEPAIRAARLMGDGISRIVDGWVELFMEIMSGPLRTNPLSAEEWDRRLAGPAARLVSTLGPLSAWLMERQVDRSMTEVSVDALERALELRGVRPAQPVEPPAIVFADLTDYTRLTEERGDEHAAVAATQLAELAFALARRHGGRVVKQLGDGAMLAFPSAAEAVHAALGLRDAADRAALPPLHVGISAGPVIVRDGDYFGRTVNLAARVASAAGPGEILVTPDAVAAANLAAPAGAGEPATGEPAVTPIGPQPLKGLHEELPLFRVDRADRPA
jgi:adenylate cyclase